MRGRWRILAVVAIAVVNGVGCGSDDHEPVEPEAMLDAAADRPIRSAETEIDLVIRVEGVPRLSEPITLRLDGPYRSAGEAGIPSFDWQVSASALGFPVGGRLVSTGDNVYLTVYGSGYEVGEAEVEAANRRIADSGALRLQVRRWLGPARVVGEGSAGGVDCERIAAPLRGDQVERDLAPLAADLGISMPAVSGSADACVGFDDRVLHELEVNATLRPAETESARLGGATAFHVNATVVSSDVGEPQEIVAPRGGSRPIRELFLDLQDFGVPLPLG
jgi:hypothetical protein